MPEKYTLGVASMKLMYEVADREKRKLDEFVGQAEDVEDSIESIEMNISESQTALSDFVGEGIDQMEDLADEAERLGEHMGTQLTNAFAENLKFREAVNEAMSTGSGARGRRVGGIRMPHPDDDSYDMSNIGIPESMRARWGDMVGEYEGPRDFFGGMLKEVVGSATEMIGSMSKLGLTASAVLTMGLALYSISQSGVWETFTSAWKQLASAFGDLMLRPFIDELRGFTEWLANLLRLFRRHGGFWEALSKKEFWMDAGGWLWDGFKGAIGAITENAGAAAGGAGDLLSELSPKQAATLTGTGAGAGMGLLGAGLLGQALIPIPGVGFGLGVSMLGAPMAAAGGAAGAGAGYGTGTFLDWVNEKAQGEDTGVGTSALYDSGKWTRRKVDQMTAGIMDAASSVRASVSEAWSSLADTLTSTGTWTTIADMFIVGLGGAIARAINALISTIEDMVDRIPFQDRPDLPRVPIPGGIGSSSSDPWPNDGQDSTHTYAASSLRYKDVLGSVTSPRDVLGLDAIRFTYHGEDSEYVGFVAEEVAESGPEEMVHYEANEDGEKMPEGIYYEQLAVYHNEILREQEEVIKSLMEEVKELGGNPDIPEEYEVDS